MAALTLPEALKRTQNPAMAAIAKEIITTDAFAAVVPMEMVAATSVPVPREGALPAGGAFIGDDGATSEESSGTDDVVHVPVRRIVGDVDVDLFAEAMASQGGSHVAAQLNKKIKATWRKVAEKLITGSHVTSHTLGSSAAPFSAIDAVVYGPWLDSNRRGPGSLKYVHSTTSWYFRAPGDIEYGAAVPATTDGAYLLRSWNQSYWIRVTLDVSDAVADGETHIRFVSSTKEWDGLEMLVHPDRLIDPTGADGDAFGFGMLDEMIRNEKIKANRAFMMPEQLTDKIYDRHRALGGTDPRTVMVPGYGGGEVLLYRGVPVLPCDWIPQDETVGSDTECTSIYLASLHAEQGLSVGVANQGSESFAVDGDPRGRIVMGWRVSSLGEREAYDHVRNRVKFYAAGPILRSTQALVRRRGVKTS